MAHSPSGLGKQNVYEQSFQNCPSSVTHNFYLLEMSSIWHKNTHTHTHMAMLSNIAIFSREIAPIASPPTIQFLITCKVTRTDGGKAWE